MKPFNILLILILLAEIGWTAYNLKNNQGENSNWIPPMPQVNFSDPYMKKDLEALAEKARTGSNKDIAAFANALLGQGYYSHAELAFKRGIELDNFDLESRFGYGFCLDRTGRVEEGNKVYEELKKDLPSQGQDNLRFRTQYSLGRNALRLEQPDKAIEYFREMGNFVSADYKAPGDYQLAKLLIRTNKIDEAIPIISKNLEKIPFSLEFLILEQKAKYRSNNEKDSIIAELKLARSAVLVDLNFNTVFITPLSNLTGFNHIYTMGTVDDKTVQNKPQDAFQPTKDLWEKVKDIRDYKRELVILELGRVSGILSDIKGVETCLEELKKMGALGPDYLNLESRYFEITDQKELAVKTLQRIQDIRTDARVSQILATWYHKKDEAKSKYYESQVYLLTGLSHYRFNRLPEADKSFSLAVEAKPDEWKALYYRALIAYFMDMKKESREYCNACLKINPNHGRAKRLLKILD